MLVCVTGGTGFVGSYVVRALLDSGYDVRVLHRRKSRLDALSGLEYQFVTGDIMNVHALRLAFEGCERVFHVAAVADYWRADTSRLFAVNVEGTRNVMQVALDCGVERVVFTSSAAAVGLPVDDTPSDESLEFNLKPEQFPYGYSKVLAEKVVQDYVERGLDAVIVNPSVVIGPGDLNMISGTFITQVHQLQWLIPKTKGGMAVSDVRDIARGHLAAADKGRTGERYLLNTSNHSNEEWFGMIARVAGVAPPLIPFPSQMIPPVANLIGLLRRAGVNTPVSADQTRLGARYVYFDASKAYHELYQPEIAVPQSVQETYDWYASQGYLRETVQTKVLQSIGNLWNRA